MKITQLAILAISSASAQEVAANPELARASKLTDSPRDRKTEGSPNALLRGAFSAEGVYAESDSHEVGAKCKEEGEACNVNEDCCGNLMECENYREDTTLTCNLI